MLNINLLKLLNNNIYFDNKKQLDLYQKKLLKNLVKKSPTNKCVTLSSSGTSSKAKLYSYSKENYEFLEDYHINRLCKFNKIENGNVFKLQYIGMERIDDPFSNSYKFLPLGKNNKTYNLFYNYDFQIKDWNNLFLKIKKLNPKFLYARPSEILLMKGANKVDFPVIVSMEQCYPYIRKVAEEIFTSCIDKMRCWDGGLSFFECCFKTKHINDELCFVESDSMNRIFSTDFFNYDNKFLNYHNGDLGKIRLFKCDCGIFGNCFEEFYGKSLESIVLTNDQAFSSNLLISAIFSQRKLSNFDFCIFQKIDKSIEIYIDKDIKNFEKQIIIDIFKNIDPKINIEIINKKIEIKNKKIFVRSEASKKKYTI